MHVMPAHAPLVVLLLLLAFVAALGGGAALLFAALTGRRTLARNVIIGGAAVGVAYLALLVGAALTSSDTPLRPGEWKYICEIDCHTAYSVQAVVRTPTLGDGDTATRAQGEFWVVTLRTWFDERTTRFRVRERPLLPNARAIWASDEGGRRYTTSLAGMRAAGSLGDPMTPLTQGLFPGDSYDTTLVFDLPASVRSPRLMLVEAAPSTRALIGHENSFLHGHMYFALTPTDGSGVLPVADGR